MSKHTELPWRMGFPATVEDEDGEELITQVSILGPKPKEIEVCELFGNKAEVVANARLIAAAPELLEALKAANAALEHLGNVLNNMDAVTKEDEAYFPIFEMVRAAISKATGDKS